MSPQEDTMGFEINDRNRGNHVPVRRTRQVKEVQAPSHATDGNQRSVSSVNERRGSLNERRRHQQKVMVDMRSGRDRRRARGGRGINISV